MRGPPDEQKVEFFACTNDQCDRGLHALEGRIGYLVEVTRVGGSDREDLSGEKTLTE
jgi:hypothetical protein